MNQTAPPFSRPGATCRRTAIGGRACPRTVELDDRTLGTIYYDTDETQPGGSGVFFRTMATASLRR